MRTDEDGNPCPSTLFEYRSLCRVLGGDCEAVQALDDAIARNGGCDDEVIVSDLTMRKWLMPLLKVPLMRREEKGSEDGKPFDGVRQVSDEPTILKISKVYVRVDGHDHEECEAQPTVFIIPGSADKFVAVFTTLEKLEVFESAVPAGPGHVHEVVDQADFVKTAVAAKVRIMVDPHRRDNGKFRFQEIITTFTPS